jgi:hypothetical protein
MHIRSAVAYLADGIPTDLGLGTLPGPVAAMIHLLLSWAIAIGLVVAFGGCIMGIIKLVEARHGGGDVQAKPLIISLIAGGLVVAAVGIFNAVAGAAAA